MRGSALFLITMVLVTRSGRAVVDEYVTRVVTIFTQQAPFSYIALASIAVSTLACVLMMRKTRAKRPVVYLVRREIRG
jgi:hypothetical protein